MLKSVHITNYYHKHSGGISAAYDQLLAASNRHKRYVRLIVPGEHDHQEEVGEYGRIYFVKADPSPVFDKRYRVMQAWNSYLFDKTRIRQILRSEQPDIIEIADKYSLSLLAGLIRKGYFKSLGRPMVVHLSCERMDDNFRAFVSKTKPFRWFARFLMRNYVFPMFDYHIANSDYTAGELHDAATFAELGNSSKAFTSMCRSFFKTPPGSGSQNVFVNNCGVDQDLFTVERRNSNTRQRLMAEFGFPSNATVLLYCGRLSPEKNVMLLPELMRWLLEFRNYDSQRRDYRLLVAGDGPLAEKLKEELGRVAARQYLMVGHITDKVRLADIYANSDIFIHPNPREPFGIGPLEAMSAGLPVVGPNSGGVLTYANDDNAWLGEADVEDYFSAVRQVFNDDVERERRISNAFITAREYSWENSTDNMFKLYDDLHIEHLRQYPEGVR